MKNAFTKKLICCLCVFAILASFSLFAIASGEDEGVSDQGSGSAGAAENKNNLGDYNVEIKSCRLSTDYEGKPVVIVKYAFTNNSENAAAFYVALNTEVYQNGVGLNESYFVDDSANYSSDNQSKEIKTGVTLEVEVAYVLNDTTTDIEVEVSEFISFSDRVVKKTFKISQ